MWYVSMQRSACAGWGQWVHQTLWGGTYCIPDLVVAMYCALCDTNLSRLALPCAIRGMELAPRHLHRALLRRQGQPCTVLYIRCPSVVHQHILVTRCLMLCGQYRQVLRCHIACQWSSCTYESGTRLMVFRQLCMSQHVLVQSYLSAVSWSIMHLEIQHTLSDVPQEGTAERLLSMSAGRYRSKGFVSVLSSLGLNLMHAILPYPT